MIKKCIKCNHVSPDWRGSDAEACPACGVVYGKAEPVAAARPSAVPPLPPAARRAPATAAAGRLSVLPGDDTAGEASAFVQRLRAQGHYPAFRSLVGVGALLGYVFAAVLAIGSVASGWKSGSWGLGLGGSAVALVVFVFIKAAKEASLMLADLSDAAVRLAQRQAREP